MKIVKKTLWESKKLIEADDPLGVEPEVSKDGTSLKVDTDVHMVGPKSDPKPATKKDALKIQNALTKVLDRALDDAMYAKDDFDEKFNCNILVTGLPGSSKTSTIMNWCAAHDCNVYYLDAKNPDLQLLCSGAGSIDRTDPEHPKVRQAYSDALAHLDKKNSILFLDELNRQLKAYLRGSLLSLIADKSVAGDTEDGFRRFPNMLFTIAAINPASDAEGTAKLGEAEKRRFYYFVTFNSEKPTTTEYITSFYNDKLIKLANNPDRPDFEAKVLVALKTQFYGNWIVNNADFFFSDLKDYEESSESDTKILCQSFVTEVLAHCRGDVERLKEDILAWSGLLKSKKEKLIAIIDKLPKLNDEFWDKLRAKKEVELNVDLKAKKKLSPEEIEAEKEKAKKLDELEKSESGEELDFDGAEDDAELAASGTTKVDAVSSDDIEAGMSSAMAGFSIDD